MTDKLNCALVFADDRPTSGGDDLYQWAIDAEDLIRELCAPVVPPEPYAVLVREIGESSFFDSKPIKPGSIQHKHAKASPHYDYVELWATPTQQGLADDAIERAAKTMSELFDYPWDFMPDQGKAKMREDVKAVLLAAQAKQGGV